MSTTRREKVVITDHPHLHVGALFSPPVREGVFKNFYGNDADLFYFGRGALCHGMRAMRLSATDNVLVPAYHCGVEIEAVSMAGVQLRYYDIQDDLTCDVQDLQNKIDSGTKAVLLIHYFGFPQRVEEIEAICKAGNIMLIEDCSQALFSRHKGKPLGTFGDIAIFSQRKTLPLPDGGALLVNNSVVAPEVPAERPSGAVAIKKTLGMLFRSIYNCDPRNPLPYPFERLATMVNRIVTKNAGTRYSTGMQIDLDRCSLAMSATAERIMNRTRIEEVIRRRRDNYTCLCGKLHDTHFMKIARKRLEEGVCPLFFPVRIASGFRSIVQERLQRCGISTFVFGDESHPTLPRDQFRGAGILAREVLCLPVHQDLNNKDMVLVAEALLEAARELDHADTH